MVDPQANTNNEDWAERAIRPTRLTDYIGQTKVREQMDLFIQAARARNEALDHTLIFGPPGLGKTTLAHIIAEEMEGELRVTSGPVLEKGGDLAAILTNLEAGDVLFIDEIHRLSPQIEEILYPVMEDFALDIMIGEGPSARSLKLDIARFTLVGATTRTGLLTSPLRDRFGIVQRLEFYNEDELSEIIKRSSKILNVRTNEKGAGEIASRSRGTPRIANRLLRRVRDYAQVRENGEINLESAKNGLSLLQIDHQGFDPLDRRLLEALIHNFDGGPVGLDTLAATLNEERVTVEDVLEPYLLQTGYLQRTPRGRIATARAYRHLGLEPPKTAHQGELNEFDKK